MFGAAIDKGPMIRAMQELNDKRREAFDFARHNLSEFIRERAEWLGLFGVRMEVSASAPETYSALLHEWRACDGTCITVSGMHCDNTIYTTPEVNHMFRFWHDYLHLEHKKPFTLAGELFIGALHCESVAAHFGAGSMEHKLMMADTIGQSTFEAVTGAFPKDQRAFAWRFVHQ